MKKAALILLIVLILSVTTGIEFTVQAEERRPLPPEEIDKLINQLGHEDWRLREAATDKLIEEGKLFPSNVVPKLRRAKLGQKDPEIRMRARFILVELMEADIKALSATIDFFLAGATAPIRRWNRYRMFLELFIQGLATCDKKKTEDALDGLIDAIAAIDATAADEVKKFLTDDTDKDGMPYWWELKWKFNPDIADGLVCSDGDGLNNDEEYKIGMNPKDPDTDGDGKNDKEDPDPLQLAYLHTPQGSNVLVSLGKEATVVFSNITVEGYIILYAFPTPTYTPPLGFRFIGYSFNVYTTTNNIGPITVTFPYDESWLLGKETKLKLFHWNDHTLEWEDVTVSIDTLHNIITGSTRSLSPFVIAEPTYPVPVGGYAVLIDEPMEKPDLLAPYIGLASTLIVAAAATAIYVKRVKHRKEKR